MTAVNLSASTIIINSIYNNDLHPGSSAAAAAVEDGLTDTLFDSGFIMFTTSNSPGYRVDGAKDARYMLSIEPLADEQAVSFTLQATVNGMVIDSGIISSSDVKGTSGLRESELYFLLGEKVAAELMLFF